MKSSIKALALIAMGLFLYSRFWNGKLFFYIKRTLCLAHYFGLGRFSRHRFELSLSGRPFPSS